MFIYTELVGTSKMYDYIAYDIPTKLPVYSYLLTTKYSYHILSLYGLNWLPCLLLCLHNVNTLSLVVGKGGQIKTILVQV